MNLYGFIGNDPMGRVDFIGLWEIDTAKHLIKVGKGEIVVLFGHQDSDNPWSFQFGSPCSGGAAIICFPDLTNGNIPDVNRINGAPNHHNWMWWYGSLTSKGQQAARRENRPADTDGDKLLAQMRIEALNKAKLLCARNNRCECDKITIHFHRNARPGVIGWLLDMNIPDAPADIVVKCSDLR